MPTTFIVAYNDLGPTGVIDSELDFGIPIFTLEVALSNDNEELDLGDEVIVNGIPTGTYAGTDGAGGIFVDGDGGRTLYTDNQALNPDDLMPAVITDPIWLCFAAGTRIATPDGATAVQKLRIGDAILTASGGETRVKWIGRQTMSRLFTPRERFEPVLIAAGALGDGLPVRDLVLTADHALLLDGLLVQACALVNGTTVARVSAAELPDRVTYYHVETEGHDVILAEGAPAETFVDNVTRRAFDNYAEYAALYGDDAEQIFELDTPRVMSARQLPASLKARIAAQTAA